MTIRTTLLIAWRGLRANIIRSLLTTLGIIIGVFSIVLVMSLGQGAQSVILNQVQSVGGDTVIVRPGRQPKGPSDFGQTVFADSLKERDITALRKTENVQGVTSITPIVIVPGDVSYRSNIYTPTTLGFSGQAAEALLHITPVEGDYFTDDDVKSQAKVAVIGDKVRKQLFGDEEALGQSIRIKQTSFRVIGILPSSGQLSVLNPDELVLIPYSTAQKQLMGIDYYNEVFVKIADPNQAAVVADEIRTTLREQHSITDPTKDDFFVVTQQNIAASIHTITNVLTLFLSAIAAISLLVGGVGIMNIMLVSVTERTQEIGLRKALGATNRDILQQFLIESLVLTSSGGLIGTVAAISMSWLVSQVATHQFGANWPFQFPLLAVLLGIGTAAGIGLSFGLYPALKAARKDPIEALRYE